MKKKNNIVRPAYDSEFHKLIKSSASEKGLSCIEFTKKIACGEENFEDITKKLKERKKYDFGI